ncbi:calaxin isoform X1 [Ovis aries]|uniref:Calaxin n=1 Tax=Ovis aries TaxID=9940 RepID=A0AC11D5N1_SHEEP|nr:calaxin isoform X1 [Ovis aries]
MNRKKLQKLTDSLTKNCKHFSKFEVKCLINLFYNLVGEVTERQGVIIGLDRNAFRNILHMTFGMTDDMIMDRVFRGFDKDNDGCISVIEWVYGLSVFLRGTLEEKMKYCFEVFDLNGDSFISKEEMFHMLKNSLLKQPSEEDPDEGIKDLVEITLKKMVRWIIQTFLLKFTSQVALVVKNLPASAGHIRDMGSIPGWGRSTGEENGNPLQYSCLQNPMDRGAWRAIVHRAAKSQTQLSDLACTEIHKPEMG